MPRFFFDQHVKLNYEDWLRSPLDERLAKNAVSDANNMAARVFKHWENEAPLKVYSARNEGAYRNELAAQECSDFGLVRDVAEAHKHFELNRPTRRLTHSNQTTSGTMGWGEGGYGEGGYGEGRFGGGEQLVVTIDDGTKRPLTAIMKNVMEMWDRLLAQWSL